VLQCSILSYVDQQRTGTSVDVATRTSEATLAERVFSRTAGAPLVAGNSVELLRDAQENYPAWIEAIRGARRWIHFESYIIHEDDQGREFRELLVAKAREGVKVRVLYDWVGALGAASRGFWKPLVAAGAEVRCFNPLSLTSPLGWMSRDHRKMIGVDGEVGFVTGLCVGCRWVGNPSRGVEPWRDTGVGVRGPAVAHIENAFASIWSIVGSPLPAAETITVDEIPRAGDVGLRVIAGVPNRASLYRLDQFVAAGARRTLWLTDAYFVGTASYVEALRDAARDGVDVRLLLPRASDILVVGSLSRVNYRPLLRAGVRIYEWNGPMLHAKTAVADGKWARVGSTNLNLASWVGNYELDVFVQDAGFADEMEEMFQDDLEHATEIVLDARKQPRERYRRPRKRIRASLRRGSAGRAAASAIGIGNAVGAAIMRPRELGPAEAPIMVNAALALVAVAIVGFKWPRVLSVPLAIFAAWVAISLFSQAYKLWRKKRRAARPVPTTATAETKDVADRSA
jgi:cardiolipin synthase A/B